MKPLGLFTDLYAIRMVESYLRRGMVGPATFSLFARPSRARPVLVAAGIDRAMEVLESFRYGPEALAYLRAIGVGDDTLDWLGRLRITGEIWSVENGTLVLGDEPLLELTAPLPAAQLVEAALLNAVHLDTLVATKAARLVRAARGRAVIDFGLRRAHGLESGVCAAIAAYLGGCAATSNLEAGRRAGIPVVGTMAHAFVQAFDREIDAFRAFVSDHPAATLLVETYDAIEGIDQAVVVAKELAASGGRLAGIRIDSEPLEALARHGRARLDAAGLSTVDIFLSGGLDEARIAEIVAEGAPADAFGVGSALVVSSDEPALDVAYKLVEYGGLGRAKYSEGKATLPGRKQVFRQRDDLTADRVERRESPGDGRALLRLAWRDGERLIDADLTRARDRAAAALASIPDAWLAQPGPARLPVPRVAPALAEEARRVRRRILAARPRPPLAEHPR